jgi:hypothetical protein
MRTCLPAYILKFTQSNRGFLQSGLGAILGRKIGHYPSIVCLATPHATAVPYAGIRTKSPSMFWLRYSHVGLPGYQT